MGLDLLTIVILEIMIVIALITDIRKQRIPNKLVLVGLLSGIIIGVFANDLADRMKAFLIVSLAFLLMYVVGNVCAGDVKFMMASSVLMGYKASFISIFTVVASGLVISIIVLLAKGKFVEFMRFTWNEIKYRVVALGSFRRGVLEKPHIENPTNIPYMYAIAIGLNLALIVHKFFLP